MAIEYFMYVNTASEPEVLVSTIQVALSAISSLPTAESSGMIRSALLIVGNTHDERGREIIREEYGLDSQVVLYFRLDKFRMSEATDSLLFAVRFVLEQVNGDLILLYNGDREVLTRVAGVVSLNSEFALWTPARLLMLDQGGRS